LHIGALGKDSGACHCWFGIQLHIWQPRWLEPVFVLRQGVGFRLCICEPNPLPNSFALPACLLACLLWVWKALAACQHLLPTNQPTQSTQPTPGRSPLSLCGEHVSRHSSGTWAAFLLRYWADGVFLHAGSRGKTVTPVTVDKPTAHLAAQVAGTCVLCCGRGNGSGSLFANPTPSQTNLLALCMQTQSCQTQLACLQLGLEGVDGLPAFVVGAPCCLCGKHVRRHCSSSL
jgi:hypothetical protein